MKRRTAIQSLGVISTHVLFPSILAGFVAGCKNPDTANAPYLPQFFNAEELKLLAKVIDIILPRSTTLAASEVNTHHFLDEICAKCLDDNQKSVVRKGFETLAAEFRLSQDKIAMISDIDQKAYSGDPEGAWFRMIKQYTLVGFFTSQEGMTKASNYVKFPGDYQGEITLDENTLNYGKTDLRYYL